MNQSLIIQTCFTIIGALIMAIGSCLAYFLNRLTQSVETLNERVAVVVEKLDSHERRIERLESDK